MKEHLTTRGLAKKILFILLLFFCLLAPAKTYALTHSSTYTPKRIVSLKPNITELLFAIGAGERVVGVTTWCDRPPDALTLPKVADYIKPDVEKIISLNPDLIVASEENSMRQPIDALEKMGIPILLLPFRTVGNLLDSTIKLGEATGNRKEAVGLANHIKKNLPATSETAKAKVLLIVGRRPLIAAGRATFLGELAEIAGGENIVGGKMPYPHIDRETIAVKKPDVIIDLSMGSEGEQLFEGLNVHKLDISDFRAGPDIARAVEKLKEIIKTMTVIPKTITVIPAEAGIQ